ncbi:T9SS type A sorting domain-containing protein [bacterium]|nr:T9SS type A sorting domain-containing protein [bacterium]
MRKGLVALLLVLLTGPALALNVVTQDQAVDLVEQSLLPQGRDAVAILVWGPVAAGTQVLGTLETVARTPAEGFVVYIDPTPTANLFHPVIYAFVNRVTGVITTYDAESPPQNYTEYTRVETAIWTKLMAAENVRAPIPKEPYNNTDPDRGERWAVLANGGHNAGNNHVRYWNDLSNIYITLHSVYGYSDDHILVLCSDGLNPAPDQSNGLNSDPDLDNDGDDDITHSCTLQDVANVFNYLAGVLTADDKLFVFWTDHGSSDGGWNTHFNLWNEESLFDWHFAELMDALPACEKISTFEPCYSGGFLDNLNVPPGPTVASSACTHDQVSWAMPPDYMYDTYVFHWTAAVKGEDAYGNPVDADYNGDSIITMDEAYRYAEIHDTSNEDPQYIDYPAGVGQGISLWPTGEGPFLVIADKEFNDLNGNMNGAPDPGETIEMTLTMTNVGSGTGSNIVGTLSTTDPYLTITQNTSYFPDLAHFEQGLGAPPYSFDISAACPQGQMVACDLHIEADSAYTNDVVISFMVGDPMYDPVGPDAYGYYIYDILDQPGGPTYDWVEICADSGGPGTLVPFVADDEFFHFELPFTFTYYGAAYDSITVGANGWIAPGIVSEEDYSNSAIPDPDGPERMIAAYWEDLSPQRTNSGRVWTWYDAVNHLYFIEYNHIEQYSPTGSFETFQVILRDPDHYPTATGDGQIVVQYKDISGTVQSEGTVGIENEMETIGVQYLFDGAYDEHAAPLAGGAALLITTIEGIPDIPVVLTPYGMPIQIPPTGGTFDYNIQITNNAGYSNTFDVWIDALLPSGSSTPVLLGPATLTVPAATTIDRDRTQAVPANAPSGIYTYNAYTGIYPSTIYATDNFDFEKLTMGTGEIIYGWENWGEPFEIAAENQVISPQKFSMNSAYPNPFNPVTTLSFDLPEAVKVSLNVYDISGRLVAELVAGWRNIGSHEVTFDASTLASGVYLYAITAGDFQASGKMVLMK